MKDFNFKIPQNIQFGMGSLKKLPEILAENHSDNILLVSDRGLEKIGVVKKVQDIIEAAGLKCTSYLDVVPNPTVAVITAEAVTSLPVPAVVGMAIMGTMGPGTLWLPS